MVGIRKERAMEGGSKDGGLGKEGTRGVTLGKYGRNDDGITA